MLTASCSATFYLTHAASMQFDAGGRLWALGRSQTIESASLKLGIASRGTSEQVCTN